MYVIVCVVKLGDINEQPGIGFLGLGEISRHCSAALTMSLVTKDEYYTSVGLPAGVNAQVSWMALLIHVGGAPLWGT